MLKPIIVFVTFMLASAALAAPQKSATLARENDFLVLSDVAAPEITIMLMYPGTPTGMQKERCGLVVRTHPFAVKVDDVDRALEIAGRGRIEDGQLLAKVERANLVADFFTIKTRSGRNLDAVIGELDASSKVEAIAAVLSCR